MAGIRDKFQRFMNPPDDEYDEYYDDEDGDQDRYDDRRGYGDRRTSYRTDPRDNKVVSLSGGSQPRVVVYHPTSFGEETKDIADELLKRHTVVLNMEKTDKDTARRIADFLSGVAYANNGTPKKIAAKILIFTPFDVDITGDEVMDELESSGIYF